MSTVLRVVSVLYAAILVFATAAHVSHILEYGWFPYSELTGAHWSLNLYWTALTVVNPLLAGFVLWRPRPGAYLFALHMVINACTNAFALRTYENLLVAEAGVVRQAVIAAVAVLFSLWLLVSSRSE